MSWGAAVIGVPDLKWGEKVLAIVVRKADNPVDENELIQRVRDEKGPVYAPKDIIFVDALTLTALGKPDKKQLRQQYAIEVVSPRETTS